MPAKPADNPAQEVPPSIRLGLRILGARQRMPVAPVVVIVPDAQTYLSALEHWRLESSWPVLIDDGSDDAHENIARFVRAFGPESIVRWTGPQDAEERQAKPLRDRIERAVADFWGAESAEGLTQHWKTIGFQPPGVVVTAEDDPAWTAAVALAAAHGQPIIWTTDHRSPPRAIIKPVALARLDQDIDRGLDALQWPWDKLGDSIDAITLCLGIPSRIPDPEGGKGKFALSDHIGRHPDGKRYAWAGILFGDHATAAYRAMCAIFLAPDSAWIFDGYEGTEYPDEFDAERALPLFERMNFDVTFTAPNGATLPTWRARCRTGIDAGFVHVNSAGRETWFQVARRERVWAWDTPFLRQPALVHFIHSFSAAAVDRPTTISGRWLENGAYAYLGSVDEPFLQAFMPAERFFTRLFSGVPFGAAGRYDNAEAWKIQIVGDPLIIAGPPRPRRDVTPNLEGATSLEQIMKSSLEEHRFSEAISMLVMLDRDQDALRVTRAALKDNPERAPQPGVARAALFAAFRAGDAQLFADLYEMLPVSIAQRDKHRSALWQILRPRLESDNPPDERIVQLLRANIRNNGIADDAWDLRGPIAAMYGRETLNAMVLELIERTKNKKTKGKLRDIMSSRPID